MEWHQHDQRTGEDAISGGHKGPILVYAAKVPSGQTAATWDGSGAVWFKLYESGLISARYAAAQHALRSSFHLLTLSFSQLPDLGVGYCECQWR